MRRQSGLRAATTRGRSITNQERLSVLSSVQALAMSGRPIMWAGQIMWAAQSFPLWQYLYATIDPAIIDFRTRFPKHTEPMNFGRVVDIMRGSPESHKRGGRAARKSILSGRSLRGYIGAEEHAIRSEPLVSIIRSDFLLQ
jgi:hypothetical protein